jgi:hypothetical protein
MIPARHLMDPWRDVLLTELRLAEVPGQRIGEVLAEVDGFCADSGQTPQEAFGDPVAYAQALVAAHPPEIERGVRRYLVPTGQMFGTIAGVFALLNGVDAVAGGERGMLTAGELVCIALGTALFPRVLALVFRPALFRRGAAWTAFLVAVPLVLAVPAVFWRTPALHLPGWALLTGGLFLLAVAWWPTAADKVFADRVIDPRTGREPFAPSRVLIAVVRWWLPVVLLVAVVVTAVIR